MLGFRGEGSLGKGWQFLVCLAAVKVIQQMTTSVARYIVHPDFGLIHFDRGVLADEQVASLYRLSVFLASYNLQLRIGEHSHQLF